MPDPQQDVWPNRTVEILVPTTILCILSTAVLAWRVIYGIQTKRKFLVCDFLLIVSAILNITATAVRFKTCQYGQGRHIADPSIIKPDDMLHYGYYSWVGQVVNLLAIAMLKFAICAYLLALRFSKVYLGIVWASILVVATFNLIIPILSVFCKTPFEANWNKGIPGKCFLKTGAAGLSYTQGASNCLTDVIYITAPIIYLSSIQLPRRTQWGLRVVFCLGLIVLICSIMKTVELPALMKTKDPTWDGNDLVIWSAVELSVGILVASLPPLRKQFDALFKKLLPSTLTGSRSKNRGAGGGSIPLHNVSKSFGQNDMPGGGRLRDDEDEDGDSERHILPESIGKGEITKTVVHEFRSDERDNHVQTPERSYGPL